MYNKKLLQEMTHNHIYNTFIVREFLNTTPIIEDGPPPRCDLKGMELKGGELNISVRENQEYQGRETQVIGSRFFFNNYGKYR